MDKLAQKLFTSVPTINAKMSKMSLFDTAFLCSPQKAKIFPPIELNLSRLSTLNFCTSMQKQRALHIEKIGTRLLDYAPC